MYVCKIYTYLTTSNCCHGSIYYNNYITSSRHPLKLIKKVFRVSVALFLVLTGIKWMRYWTISVTIGIPVLYITITLIIFHE